VKFLIDRCAGRTLSNWLIQQGYDTVHVADLGPDPGDHALLQQALAQGRALITIDSDFGTLAFRDAVQHCGIIRLPDVPAYQRVEIMKQLLATHPADIESGAVITVRGSKIRITPAKPPPPGTIAPPDDNH
jgi:predicted nuclease of predicted toxin-antitoxin system